MNYTYCGVLRKDMDERHCGEHGGRMNYIVEWRDKIKYIVECRDAETG